MNKKSFKIVFLLLLIACSIISCDNEISIPKPSTHLMVDLPEHSYKPFNDSTNYSFQMSKLWSLRFNFKKQDSLILYLGKQIDGDLHFQYYKIDTLNTLAKLINQTFAKIDYHKVKAQQIKDTTFIFANKRVFGTLYEYIGNSATNYQFYLTDSTNHFVRTELLIRRVPNYDSLQPTLHYIRKDLIHLINTFEWKKQ
jgi:gliding motility-associated lipoprotein GldD